MRLEIGVDLLERHVAIAVEIDELDLAEDGVVPEEVPVQQPRGGVFHPVVGLARLENEAVDLAHVDRRPVEQLRGEARLEQLAARQPGHDQRDALVARGLEPQGVDRLEAAVADVGVALQAVDEDGVHARRGHEAVLDAQGLGDPSDVGLGLVRQEAVVEGRRQDARRQLGHAAERVGAVLAAGKKHQAVEAAGPARAAALDQSPQLVHGAEVSGGLLLVDGVVAADAADPRFVDLHLGIIGAQPALAAARRRGRRRLDQIEHAVRDPAMGQHHLADLGELDADTPNLDLFVGAAVVAHHAARRDGGEIAGLVHSAAGQEGIGQEPLHGFLCHVLVAVGQAVDPADVEFADDVVRYRVQSGIEHVDAGRLGGPSDRHGGAGIVRRIEAVEHAADRRLGRAVLIEDLDMAAQHGSGPAGQGDGQVLTAQHESPDAPHRLPRLDRQLQMGGGQLDHVHRIVGEHL